MSNLRLALEGVALLLSIALIFESARLARLLARQDRGQIRAQLFLHADDLQRFVMWSAVAIALFVAMPASILAYIVMDQDAFEIAHDASHVVFLVLALVAWRTLRRRLLAAR